MTHFQMMTGQDLFLLCVGAILCTESETIPIGLILITFLLIK